MRLEDFFRRASVIHMQHDPLGKKVVLHNLETKRKDCDALRPAEKTTLVVLLQEIVRVTTSD